MHFYMQLESIVHILLLFHIFRFDRDCFDYDIYMLLSWYNECDECFDIFMSFMIMGHISIVTFTIVFTYSIYFAFLHILESWLWYFDVHRNIASECQLPYHSNRGLILFFILMHFPVQQTVWLMFCHVNLLLFLIHQIR